MVFNTMIFIKMFFIPIILRNKYIFNQCENYFVRPILIVYLLPSLPPGG